MHISADNQPLGTVDEARCRREQYARYIKKRAAVPNEHRATQHRIEQLVNQRIEAEVAGLGTERATCRLADIERVVMPEDR